MWWVPRRGLGSLGCWDDHPSVLRTYKIRGSLVLPLLLQNICFAWIFMFGVSRSGLVWLAGRCLSFSNAGAGFFSFGGAFPCTIVCGSVFSRPVQLYMTLLILLVLYIRILLLVNFLCVCMLGRTSRPAVQMELILSVIFFRVDCQDAPIRAERVALEFGCYVPPGYGSFG